MSAEEAMRLMRLEFSPGCEDDVAAGAEDPGEVGPVYVVPVAEFEGGFIGA